MAEPTEPVPLTSPGPPRIELFMTVIRVGNWSAIVRWYTEMLGLKPILLDEQHEFALLGAGSGRLGVQGAKEARAGAGSGRSAIRLVFQVRDLDRERQRLIEQGVSVSPPVENLDEGYREVRLQDPEGNSLRLFAWTEPARGDRFAGHRR